MPLTAAAILLIASAMVVGAGEVQFDGLLALKNIFEPVKLLTVMFDADSVPVTT